MVAIFLMDGMDSNRSMVYRDPLHKSPVQYLVIWLD